MSTTVSSGLSVSMKRSSSSSVTVSEAGYPCQWLRLNATVLSWYATVQTDNGIKSLLPLGAVVDTYNSRTKSWQVVMMAIEPTAEEWQQYLALSPKERMAYRGRLGKECSILLLHPELLKKSRFLFFLRDGDLSFYSFAPCRRLGTSTPTVNRFGFAQRAADRHYVKVCSNPPLQ